MVARGGAVRAANYDAEGARRVRIGLSRSESIELSDTRIFSIRLCLSTEFSIDLGGLIKIRFQPITLTLVFCIYRSLYVLFSAHLHRIYAQESSPCVN